MSLLTASCPLFPALKVYDCGSVSFLRRKEPRKEADNGQGRGGVRSMKYDVRNGMRSEKWKREGVKKKGKDTSEKKR